MPDIQIYIIKYTNTNTNTDNLILDKAIHIEITLLYVQLYINMIIT